jgi:hypothetical protein
MLTDLVKAIQALRQIRAATSRTTGSAPAGDSAKSGSDMDDDVPFGAGHWVEESVFRFLDRVQTH